MVDGQREEVLIRTRGHERGAVGYKRYHINIVQSMITIRDSNSSMPLVAENWINAQSIEVRLSNETSSTRWL